MNYYIFTSSIIRGKVNGFLTVAGYYYVMLLLALYVGLVAEYRVIRYSFTLLRRLVSLLSRIPLNLRFWCLARIYRLAGALIAFTIVLIYGVVESSASLSIIESNVAICLDSASVFFNLATGYY